MATKKISDLAAGAALADADLFEIEQGGLSKKSTIGAIVTRNKAAIKLDELAAPTDVVTLNSAVGQHGLLKKLSGVATQYMGGDGNWSVPAGTEWDTIIVKSGNQDVTNNATPQNDTELFYALPVDGLYRVELFLVYAGNDGTGDYRGRLTFPASEGVGTYTYINQSLAIASAASNIASTTIFPLNDFLLGATGNIAQPLVMRADVLAYASAGTLQYAFANVAASSGRISRTYKGSCLRVKLIGTLT